MHRFFASPNQFHIGVITLEADETRHLRDVLRLNSGDVVRVFDGGGREFECRIDTVSKNSTQLSIDSEIEPSSPESSLDLTLAAAMLKGEKFDLIVQKAVELGVRRLFPLRTVRTDVRSKDSAARVARWRKIVLEASKQSGRAFLMTIEEPVDYEMFLSIPEGGPTILFSEREGDKLPAKSTDKKLTAVVGPEGGWDDVELAAAKSAGFDIVTLGGRVMRAETAAIAISAILQHRFGDLN
jgi:16S rRNA (uracil1498-N3)-methyltransferase